MRIWNFIKRVVWRFIIYLRDFLEGTDKYLNGIGGGNYEVTVSARCGYYNLHNGNWFWRTCAGVIDFSFYPYQGWGHCEQARKGEKDRVHEEGPIIVLGIFLILTTIVCLILSIISYLYLLINKIINLFKR